MDSQYKYKTATRPFYIFDGNADTGKMAFQLKLKSFLLLPIQQT